MTTMENLFSFPFRVRAELLKYVYFCAQKSIIKAGNNKFQDLINAPRIEKMKLVLAGNILFDLYVWLFPRKSKYPCQILTFVFLRSTTLL